MSLGVEIGQARRRKCMTQRELAAKCGCTVAGISNIERGASYPREPRMLIEIAAVLGVPERALLLRIDLERARPPIRGNSR